MSHDKRVRLFGLQKSEFVKCKRTCGKYELTGKILFGCFIFCFEVWEMSTIISSGRKNWLLSIFFFFVKIVSRWSSFFSPEGNPLKRWSEDAHASFFSRIKGAKNLSRSFASLHFSQELLFIFFVLARGRAIVLKMLTVCLVNYNLWRDSLYNAYLFFRLIRTRSSSRSERHFLMSLFLTRRRQLIGGHFPRAMWARCFKAVEGSMGSARGRMKSWSWRPRVPLPVFTELLGTLLGFNHFIQGVGSSC